MKHNSQPIRPRRQGGALDLTMADALDPNGRLRRRATVVQTGSWPQLASRLWTFLLSTNQGGALDPNGRLRRRRDGRPSGSWLQCASNLWRSGLSMNRTRNSLEMNVRIHSGWGEAPDEPTREDARSHLPPSF